MTQAPSPRRSFSFLFLGLASMTLLLLSNCALVNTAVGVGLVKMQFGCLVEGTPIDTPDGQIAVEDLKTGDMVIGYRGAPVAIQQIHQYHEDPAAHRHLTVTFASGAKIQLSKRHRINGIPAEQLEPGDRIEDHLVTEVSSLSGVSRSFDLLTADSGYRTQGIPVNSMIEEMASHSSEKSRVPEGTTPPHRNAHPRHIAP